MRQTRKRAYLLAFTVWAQARPFCTHVIKDRSMHAGIAVDDAFRLFIRNQSVNGESPTRIYLAFSSKKKSTAFFLACSFYKLPRALCIYAFLLASLFDGNKIPPPEVIRTREEVNNT